MKAFFALTLAALCQSAYCMRDGSYIIASGSQVLTERMHAQGKPLIFEAKNDKPGQIWDFIPMENGYFKIQNDRGEYINCGEYEDGATCFAGEKPELFLPEYQNDNCYQLVAKGREAKESGYFLRIAKNGELKLAEYDDSESEKFKLVRV
ncbi:hypothetical protein N7448_010138 [Penicillium atrosanguineum]|uniref:Uncharacterized protein n=1 Tax=Penicillium atrosanguineum TaxID=1132637 RepID=A0A9W9PLB7_9EURO|nr:uncharacterized protein N7443_007360 [Penicillium atrosanguineum]KAJ5118431.1 hypothetical protein N7526_010068 [Penicillium atrosanguineum]KAJ5119469.1 hypothetical protein N7448_010138 [Penicillium atrosanguineum]KAJ5296467.1 hypothetical protein N7443_007360 [Penicillium atrosanguineum]KAJ5299235.1 hypothetical protein N7476_010792 [Penicillium atrosanguineum]